MSLPDEFIQSGAMQTGMSSSIEYINGRQKAIRYNYRTFTGYFEDVGTYLMGPVKVITRTKEYLSEDRKSTRLNSSHVRISYAVFCLKKKKKKNKKLKEKKKKKTKKKSQQQEINNKITKAQLIK